MSQDQPLNIAVIGSGIAGLSAAWSLSRNHRVSLYEQNDYLGGHSNTVDVTIGTNTFAVDTGFIVFNPPNYPYLCNLFKHLRIETVKTNMSFGVSLRGGAFEYAGSDLNGLFAQRGNVLKLRFWQMVKDIRRFYIDAPKYLASPQSRLSIGELLEYYQYSDVFIDDHLIPMAAAIWSASREDIVAYPADAFIHFFSNHGLLELGERPVWHTVKGGSRKYVQRLVQDTNLAAQINAKAIGITRRKDAVIISDTNGGSVAYDNVVVATHADEALALLAHPTKQEQSVLGEFRYSANEAVLHTDDRLMPTRRAAWSSWNYIQPDPQESKSNPLCVSYWMNRLQALETSHDIMVTLNPSIEPAPEKLLGKFQYSHPIFNLSTSQAQQQSIQIQGADRLWFCGSYMGHGFHEDAIQSGLWVAEKLGSGQQWHQAAPFSRMPPSYRTVARQTA